MHTIVVYYWCVAADVTCIITLLLLLTCTLLLLMDMLRCMLSLLMVEVPVYILSLLLIEILRCTDIVDGDVEVYTVVVAGVVVVGGYIDMPTVVAVGRDTDIYIYIYIYTIVLLEMLACMLSLLLAEVPM